MEITQWLYSFTGFIIILEVAIFIIVSRIPNIGNKYGGAISGWVSLLVFAWQVFMKGIFDYEFALRIFGLIALVVLFAFSVIVFVSRKPEIYFSQFRIVPKLLVRVGILLNFIVPIIAAFMGI